MARLPRICPPGIPQHIIQRGDNRHVCFASEQDVAAYANWHKPASCMSTPEKKLNPVPLNDLSVLIRTYLKHIDHLSTRSLLLWFGREGQDERFYINNIVAYLFPPSPRPSPASGRGSTVGKVFSPVPEIYRIKSGPGGYGDRSV